MGNNLSIFADATISSGTYDKIKVFGSAEITGDVVVEDMKVFGDSTIEGKCKVDSLHVFGSCEFRQYAEIKNMNIKGSCEFEDDVKVEYLKIFGEVSFNKNLFKAKEITVFGEVNVSTLEANIIKVHGYVDCKEQLNGEIIEISTNSGSDIKEMVGTKIEVKPHKKFFSVGKGKSIYVETIEGDEIYLENVVAKAVRGNKITIGPNCKIDVVEYHEQSNISEKSEVKQIEKY